MRAEPRGVRARPATSPSPRVATLHLHRDSCREAICEGSHPNVTFALAALRLVGATPCLVAFMIHQEKKSRQISSRKRRRFPLDPDAIFLNNYHKLAGG